MSIELATPISHLFKDAINADRISTVSDCLECRDHSPDSKLPRQFLLHSDANLIHPWDEEQRSVLQEVFRGKPDLKLVTFHAAVNCATPSIRDGMYQSGGLRYSRAAMRDHALENVRWLHSQLHEDIRIAVENNNYYPTGAYDVVTDGDFLAEVTERTGCMFLLDVAHALISAHNSGRNTDDYLSSLPLARTIQIHLCKPDLPPQGMARDVHDRPDRAMCSMVAELAARLPVEYITVEYYKDAGRLIETLVECRQLLAGVSQ